MTTLTAYSDPPDGALLCQDTTYSDAREGLGSLDASTVNDTNRLGQSDEYNCWEGYLAFDTSSIPDAATISSVVLSLYGSSDDSDTDFTIEARIHDWGGTLTSADWVNGSALSGKTRVATFATSSWSTSGYNAFTEDGTNFVDNINKSGITYIHLSSSRQRAGNTPTGDEYVTWYSANETGTSKDPKLVIVYTVPVALAGSAALTVEATADMKQIQRFEAPGEVTLDGTARLSITDVPLETDYQYYNAYLNRQGLLLHDGQDAIKRTDTLPLELPRQDVGNTPNEIPSALGRWFASNDWTHGAGQPFAHLSFSDPSKFDYLEGFDTSEPGELSHLRDVATAAGGALTASSSGRSCIAQGKIFVADGTGIRVYDTITGSVTTENPHAGEGAVTVQDLTAEGDEIFVALGTNGIHKRNAAGTYSHYSDAQAIRIAYLKERLIAATALLLYEITASGAAPSPKSTLKAGWTFTDLAETGQHVYASAIYETGGLSRIYHYGLDDSLNFIELGSSVLPEDDLVYSLKGYLGLMLIGGGRKNDDGGKDTLLYKSVPSDGGFLSPELVMDSEGAGADDLACRAIAIQGRRFLLGWTLGSGARFGVREGLAIYDPAFDSFAHHLASSTTTSTPETVLSVQSFEGRIVFVTDDGVYYEDLDNYVDEATLISSAATFGNTGPKNWPESRITHEALVDGTSIEFYYTTLKPEEDDWREAGISDVEGETEIRFSHANVRSQRLNLKIVSHATTTLDSPAVSVAPVIESFAVRSSATTDRSELRLIRTFKIAYKDRSANDDREVRQIPREIRDFIRSLHRRDARYYEADKPTGYIVEVVDFQEVAPPPAYRDRVGDPKDEVFFMTVVMDGVEA